MDIEKIREAAILFLDVEPEPSEKFPEFVVFHPFFNSVVLTYRKEDGELEMFDYREKEKYESWKKELKTLISKSNIWSIFAVMNSAYYMDFFCFIHSFITDKSEFAEVLKTVWSEEEFPNYNNKKHLDEILNFFQTVRDFIMDKEEKKIFDSLEDNVIIYRGQSKPGKRYDALSWTLDYDKAKWFAGRFNSSGVVYKAEISKNDICVILNNRGEMEVIADYGKLKNVKVVE